MRSIRSILIAVLLGALLPTSVWPQALTNLSSVRVAYNTRKVTANPQGEFKAQIDALDKEIAEAARLGRNGELRRLFAKGTTLLAGRPWTDVADFTASLVVRSERVAVDSTRPYAVRLEQIYSPSIELSRPLTAHAMLRKRSVAGAAAQPDEAATDLGRFDGVPRDLRESPFAMELDLHAVVDGSYQLTVDVQDDTRPLGSATLGIVVRKGLDDTMTHLRSAAARAPESFKADILYPVDRIGNANRGRIELRTFDLAGDLASAEAVVTATAGGKDPFAGRTGDFKRHYLLDAAGEIMPYRLYVPTSYSPARTFPLIIALHGLGQTEDSFFDAYGKRVPQLAEQHGYIVAAPLGFRVDGFYGYGLSPAPSDPVARRVQELSEQDVMQVLQRVKQQYKIDESRIYLLGHSMGAIGTWRLAPKYPDIWAALAPISGMGVPSTIERVKHVPEIVVHGDADPTVPVSGSRTMVAKMKELGVEVTYIEVPGGNHTDIAVPNLPAIFDFFDAHRKTARPTQ